MIFKKYAKTYLHVMRDLDEIGVVEGRVQCEVRAYPLIS
jgi:hypothetical protein